MINLNGIQIDEAELRRQLEAQGYEVRKAEPSFFYAEGTKGYLPVELAHNKICGGSYAIRWGSDDPCGISSTEASFIPDELIRAYEELSQTVACMPRWTISGSQVMVGVLKSFVSGVDEVRDKIAALKAQGEKR